MGQGAFGEVYLYETSRGECAIKKVNSEKMTDKGYPISFVSELDLLTKLRGVEGAVQLLGMSLDREAPGESFIVMEAMDCDLREWSKKKDFMDRLKIIPSLISTLAPLLGLLHKYSLIHGDIKTNNILVSKRGNRLHFKLGDFGKARVANKRTPYPCALRYSSPNYPGLELDPFQCEMWAFMIVLVEVLIGGHNMIYLKSPDDFYNKYKKGEKEYNLRLFLYQCLERVLFNKIPDSFWEFADKVMSGTFQPQCSPEDEKKFLLNSCHRSKGTGEYVVKELGGKVRERDRETVQRIATKFFSLVSEKLEESLMEKYYEACCILLDNNMPLLLHRSKKSLLYKQYLILEALNYQIYLL